MRTLDARLDLWADALASRDPALITSLYAPKALLLATLGERPKVGHAQILPYFQNLMEKPGLACEFQRIWIPADRVLAGLYEFRWTGDSLPARFTFVFGPTGRIQHHHSSVLP